MNPLLIMALLAAASQAANYQSQKKVDNSRANAMAEEERRRKVAEASSAESARSTTQLLTDAGKNQDTKAAQIEAQYAAHAPAPNVTATPQLSGFTAPAGSTLTIADDQRAMDRARADTSALAKAKAGLNAFGDSMVGAQIGAERNREDINQQNTGVRNWNQFVLPAKMAKAAGAGQDWSTLADALQLASAIYGPIGLGKGAAGGLKTAYDVSTTSGAGGANPNFWASLA